MSEPATPVPSAVRPRGKYREPRNKEGKGGKPSKLTPKFIARVKALAARGLNQHQIAIALGVGESTMSIWKRGRNDAEVKFSKAIKAGEVAGIERRLKRLEEAGKRGSWQADAWTLERRYPDQFARRDNVRLGDPDGAALKPATTVVAPQVVFVLPKKDELREAQDAGAVVEANGHAGLLGVGKEPEP